MKTETTVAATCEKPPIKERLSLDLIHPDDPERCKACGAWGNVSRWQEHNDADGPTRVVVVLCGDCSARIIEKHPRLYRELDVHEPWPGCMEICQDCRHRKGTKCSHPEAKWNGGRGVILTMPKPMNVHLSRVPRRLSGWVTFWQGPVSHCQQKQVNPINPPPASPAAHEERT